MSHLDVTMQLRLRHSAVIERRQELGLTQVQVAQLANIPLRDVCAFESLRWADVRDAAQKAAKLAAGLDLPPEVVMPPDLADVAVQRVFTKSARMDIAALAHSQAPMLPDDAASRSHAIALVRQAVSELPDKYAAVLRKRWGLDGGRELTLEEVGEDLGKSAARVRQLECRAIRILRQSSPVVHRAGNAIVQAAEELDILRGPESGCP